MAQSNRYNLALRRRREQKTNYKRRLSLLKSRQHRFVVRKTNAHTIVQVVKYEPDGDVVVAQASSAQLPALGWKGSTGNVPAAYLTGFVAATRAQQAGVKNAVTDLGMQEPFHGGRLFAAVRGAIDAGLSVPAAQDALPSDDRVTGAHIDDALPKTVEAVKKKVGA